MEWHFCADLCATKGILSGYFIISLIQVSLNLSLQKRGVPLGARGRRADRRQDPHLRSGICPPRILQGLGLNYYFSARILHTTERDYYRCSQLGTSYRSGGGAEVRGGDVGDAGAAAVAAGARPVRRGGRRELAGRPIPQREREPTHD